MGIGLEADALLRHVERIRAYAAAIDRFDRFDGPLGGRRANDGDDADFGDEGECLLSVHWLLAVSYWLLAKPGS